MAESLARLRSRLLERDRIGHAGGVELAARTLCKMLRQRSARFDGRRFMRTVLGE